MNYNQPCSTYTKLQYDLLAFLHSVVFAVIFNFDAVVLPAHCLATFWQKSRVLYYHVNKLSDAQRNAYKPVCFDGKHNNNVLCILQI